MLLPCGFIAYSLLIARLLVFLCSFFVARCSIKSILYLFDINQCVTHLLVQDENSETFFFLFICNDEGRYAFGERLFFTILILLFLILFYFF